MGEHTNMTTDEKTVLLAVLLRGLAEYSQRAEPPGATASERQGGVTLNLAVDWQADFARCVDAELLKELVHLYQESSPLLDSGANSESTHTRTLFGLLRSADHLASPERLGDASNQTSRPRKLAPIFDCIELTKEHSPAPRWYPSKQLRPTGDSEPPPFIEIQGEDVNQSDASSHKQNFNRRLDELRDYVDWDDFHCVYTHLLAVLQSYAWCIPSGAQTGRPEVSLYDRLRSTAAIASCLYKYHSTTETLSDEAISALDQKRCVLLTGGVSGIQDYIFGISTTGAGGVAKRLRARSFFVQLLSEAASLRVLREFHSPLSNLLMASGGKFYILLPNLPDTADRLTRLQNEFDESLLKGFHGELAVNFAWTEMSDGDFAAGRFSVVLAHLNEQLQHRKARRLAGALQAEGGWRSADVFVREPFDGEHVCEACGRFAAKHPSDKNKPLEIDTCNQCFDQLSLGRRLTQAQYISFFNGGGGRVPCLGLSATIDDRPHRDAFLVVRLNNPDLSRAGQWPVMFRYIATYIPRDKNGDPRPFDDIAGTNKTGIHLLGILKADVDYLGQVFQEGLRRESAADGLDTLPRVAALSRELDWFFSGWLDWLLSTKYKDCYTVYSGGDDLLIVGPRRIVLSLAREIYEEFKRYTGHPEITLSAGIAVVKPRLPLAHTVKVADGALDRAKNQGRNKLCVLGETLEWKDAASLAREITDLYGHKPRSSFLYHLLRCGQLWQSYQREGELLGLRYHPMLAYQMARNINQRNEAGLYQWAARLLEIPTSDSTRGILNHLRLISQWVLLDRREKEDGNDR